MQKRGGTTGKANLIHPAEQEETIRRSVAKVKNGVPVLYSLKTIRARESDYHRLVIGVRQKCDSQDGVRNERISLPDSISQPG